MATSTSFKQQCPSCEAMVPIRDLSLIGRKIDCPKCKYRFVVEEPEPAEDEDGDRPSTGQKTASKTAPHKNGAGGVKAPVKGKVPARTKPGKKDADEDDREASPKKKRKKKGDASSNKLMLGLALAGVGVVVLCVAAYFMFFTGETKPTPKKDPKPEVKNPEPDKVQPPEGEKTEEKAPPANEAAAKALLASVPLTNLLLKKTDLVAHFHFQEALSSSLGNLLLGQFPDDYMKSRLGFTLRDIDQVIRTVSYREGWAFTVVHLKAPLIWDTVAKAMELEDAKDVRKGKYKYFKTKNNPWANGLARLSLTKLADSIDSAGSNPICVHQYDDQTLVMGDVLAMQQFLDADRQPDKAVIKVPAKGGGGPGMPNMPGGPMGGGSGPRMPAGPGGGPPMGGGSGPRMPAGPGGGPPMGGGNGPMGGGANPNDGGADEDKKEEDIPARYQQYLTIDGELRDMLVRMNNVGEKSKDMVLCHAAVSLREPAARKAFRQMWDITQWMPQVPGFVTVVGSALLTKDDQSYTFRSGIECQNGTIATVLAAVLTSSIGPEYARVFTALTGIRMPMGTDEPKRSGSGPGNGPRGPGGSMMPPGGNGPMGPGGGQIPKMPMGPGGGPNMPNMPKMPGGPNMPGGGAGQRADDEDLEDAEVREISEIVIRQSGRRILFRMNVVMSEEERKSMEKLTTLVFQGLRGDLDSLSGSGRLHQLSRAANAMAVAKKRYPQAALFRSPDKKRSDYRWEPDQRVSWMAELLPYMGRQDLRDSINPKYSWSDPQNIMAARTLVPEFLDPGYPASSHYVNYPGAQFTVAATHFVGLAGVGEDSADLADLSAADKGVLAYDRETPWDIVSRRGAANTAVLVQVPPDQAGAWLAGGGSTVRGVPARQSIQPFVVPYLKGTHVLMADGSVRFVKDTVSDEVFKSMARINGTVAPKTDDWTEVKAPAKGAETPQPAPAVLPPPMKLSQPPPVPMKQTPMK